jgi:hypothetical protein
MKSSSISVSNAMVLTPRDWLYAVVISAVIISAVYFGWGSWERYEPGPDHRETCWAELQSDYWAYMRWIRYARDHYDILLLGDSVVWGQEVSNDRTISHYLNEQLGGEKVANVGNDGLFMAGINGAVRYYGDYLNDTDVIVQCNPLWFDTPQRDLRGEKKSRYHHPRLIPQFDPRITYYHDLNTRLGYQIEHSFRVFPFVRHLMANYFDNTSISKWMNDHPYENPFAEITFMSSDVMAEKQGRGVDWETKEMDVADKPFVELDESIQLELFMDALDRIRQKGSRVFVLIGPYNQHHLVPSSRAVLFERMTELKQVFDDRGYPYYDTFSAGLPSRTFADNCHLLAEGHEIVARALAGDPRFQEWSGGTQ